jgi:hypothetical protein
MKSLKYTISYDFLATSYFAKQKYIKIIPDVRLHGTYD